MNAAVNVRVLDKIVWDKVESILLNPAALIEGYEQTVEEHKKTVERRLLQIDVLERNLLKLEEKRHNLTSVYLDPDIRLSKPEYIKQRDQFDDEEETIHKRIDALREELSAVPEPAQIEVLQQFSEEIADELIGGQALSLARKKKIIELINIKVIYHPDGRVLLDGWLNVPEEQVAIDPGMSVPGKPRVVSTSTSTTTPSNLQRHKRKRAIAWERVYEILGWTSIEKIPPLNEQTRDCSRDRSNQLKRRKIFLKPDVL